MRAFTGTARLARLALRRDRLLLPAWLISIGGLSAAMVGSVTGLYVSDAERVAAVSFNAANVVSRIFDGPASGTAVGAMVMVQAYSILAVLVSLMTAQAVVRHTRLEEETGRAELLGSMVVGRHARLAAALVVALGSALAAGTVVTAVLVANDLAITGSLAAGAAVSGVGAVFAAVAAVSAQVSATARAANATAGAVVAVAFALRGIGDAIGMVSADGVQLTSAWPSWLSPIGWGQQVRPFHQDNVEVFALFGGLALLLVGLAAWLSEHRDVGAGMIDRRPGPDRAAPDLCTPLGLAWRQQRTTLLGWSIGLSLTGAAFGAVGRSAEEVVGISEQLETSLRTMAPGGDLVQAYFSLVVGFLGTATAAYTVQALLRMRTEEASGRLEPVLATATARSRWLASHLAIAATGTVALLGLLGLSGTLAYGMTTGRWASGAEGLLGGALTQAPAALAMGAIVVLTFGAVPRIVGVLAWSALAVSLLMGQLGALLELPQMVLNLSPFTHVAGVAGQAAIPALVILAVMAVGLAMTGALLFARRDLA